MVRAACPGTAGSHGDAGGSSVVRTRAGCWPRSSKTCACRVKRAAGLQASPCRPTGCALPAPRPRDTHIARALQGRSHVPTLYCQEELSRLPSALPVTRWWLCAGWASAGPWCLKTERKVLGLFQLLHQRKTQKEGGEEYGKGQKSPGCCVIPRSRLAGRKNIYLFLIPPVKKKKKCWRGDSAGERPGSAARPGQKFPSFHLLGQRRSAERGRAAPQRDGGGSAGTAATPERTERAAPSCAAPNVASRGGRGPKRTGRRASRRTRSPQGTPHPLRLAPAPRPRSNAKNAGLPVPPPAPPRSRAVLTLRGRLPARAGCRHGTGVPGSATPRRPRGERLVASHSPPSPLRTPVPPTAVPQTKGSPARPGPARSRCPPGAAHRPPAAAPLPAPPRSRPPGRRHWLLRPGSLPWQRQGPPTGGGAGGMRGPAPPPRPHTAQLCYSQPLAAPRSPTQPLSVPPSPAQPLITVHSLTRPDSAPLGPLQPLIASSSPTQPS